MQLMNSWNSFSIDITQ